MKKQPIGKITTKKTVYCSICGCSHKRIVNVKIYENTETEINKAKERATFKITKEYTCRICTSIIKEV